MINTTGELDNQTFADCAQRFFNSDPRMKSFSASTSGVRQPKLKGPMDFLVLILEDIGKLDQVKKTIKWLNIKWSLKSMILKSVFVGWYL